MSTIKNEQKHCQHLTPYRFHSMSQNLEEAEQLLCSVGGSRRFGTGEQCKSAAAQTRLVYTVSSTRLTFSAPSQPLGLPACPGTLKGPRCFSADLRPHASPEGQQPVEWAWMQHCFPGKLLSSPTRALWASGETRATSGTKCCFSSVRLQVQNARAWLFSPVSCSQDNTRSSTAMENYYPPVAVLQGCCLDCLIHYYFEQGKEF